jgi:hypothetical protein
MCRVRLHWPTPGSSVASGALNQAVLVARLAVALYCSVVLM